jgi:hypothetical protein
VKHWSNTVVIKTAIMIKTLFAGSHLLGVKVIMVAGDSCQHREQ